jgi:hypothetical protein
MAIGTSLFAEIAEQYHEAGVVVLESICIEGKYQCFPISSLLVR